MTGQISAVDELLTGTENLALMADLHHLSRPAGCERTATLLEQFGLTEAAGKPVATYSGGMKRKLDLAMTLVGSPAVVLLDELGLLVLLGLALAWLCVAMGLNARSVETASNTPMILLLLPFLGSGFVPVETMPTAVRWFAEYQPFTPIIETVRGLLAGGAALDGGVAAQAVAWCVVLGVAGYAWARALYRRERRI